MKNNKTASIGIIGLGRFGMALAKKLSELGKEVLVVDQNESKIKEARSFTEYAFVAEDLSKETLQETGIQNCEVVIVCIGTQIDASILTTLNIVSLGVNQVIAKATSHDQGCVLEKIGAQVVYPEHDMAIRLAKRIASNSVLDHIALSNEIEISEVKIGKRLIGQSVLKTDIRKKYGLNIIAIKHQEEIITDISPEYTFFEDDIVVVIGKTEQVQQIEKEFVK